jgi:hypothetical protein
LLTASRDLYAPPPPIFHADFTGYNGATSSVDSPRPWSAAAPVKPGGRKCKKAKKKHRHHRAASQEAPQEALLQQKKHRSTR